METEQERRRRGWRTYFTVNTGDVSVLLYVILQCMYMCIEYCMFIFDVIVY